MSQLKGFLDTLLTSTSSGIFPQGFICEKILPVIQHDAYTGKLGKYGTSHLRIVNANKGGKSKYRRVEAVTRSTDSFSIEGHGLESLVTKEDYANFKEPFDAEKDEVMGLTTLLYLEKEKLLADTLSDETILTNYDTLDGEDQISDYANSNPVEMFLDIYASVRNKCGMKPDTLILDEIVRDKLAFHPQLMKAMGFTEQRPGGLTDIELAKVLQLKRVLVGSAVYESAADGAASAILPVWGRNMVLGVLPETAVPMQTSGGYMVRLKGTTPRKVYKQTVFNPPGASEILVEDEYDMLISNISALYLIKDAIAAQA